MVLITKARAINTADVALIHYCSYWRSYCLILKVDDSGLVLELDSFRKNSKVGKTPVIREHRTWLRYGDKLFTIAEFAEMSFD